jgi:hypothetical protein
MTARASPTRSAVTTATTRAAQRTQTHRHVDELTNAVFVDVLAARAGRARRTEATRNTGHAAASGAPFSPVTP